MNNLSSKCPVCGQPANLCALVCRNCGAQLQITCPSCGKSSFIQNNCRYCRTSLYVECENPGCRKQQLIPPDGKCRLCGMRIESILSG